jgi:hypothetical protein
LVRETILNAQLVIANKHKLLINKGIIFLTILQIYLKDE